jgi:hypothetical protein
MVAALRVHADALRHLRLAGLIKYAALLLPVCPREHGVSVIE